MGAGHADDGFARRQRLERLLHRRQARWRLERHELDREFRRVQRSGRGEFFAQQLCGRRHLGRQPADGQLDLRSRSFVPRDGPRRDRPAPAPTDTFTTKIDWLLFVEPRIGYSWDRTMVFVKGGWAGGDATLSATGPAAGGIATATGGRFRRRLDHRRRHRIRVASELHRRRRIPARPARPRHRRVVRPVSDRHSDRRRLPRSAAMPTSPW